MSLRSVYERFIASPNPLSLSENASLHYLPTLTTFNQSGPIIKHLENQARNVVNKKAEKVIDIVEGRGALVAEVETTLEFISGGGAYLPGLENFITDKVAILPVTHTVHFDNEDKIRLIRIAWDQGSLLKQVDVIGSRGKNWPICDGVDQARLITSSSRPSTAMSAGPPMSPRGREANGCPAPARSMSPNKKHIKDPYTSLDLFEDQKENRREYHPVLVAPRASAKPAPRDMSDLFAAGHEDYESSQQNGGSPKKVVNDTLIAPKGAGSQNFRPSRLFDQDSDFKSPAGYKSNPAKYNHFDIGDAAEYDPLQYERKTEPAATIPMRAKTTKHGSQWGFEDFVTPDKAAPKARSEAIRHQSLSEDDGATGETPGKYQAIAKPRPDTEPHFEFQDDGTPIMKKPVVFKPRPDARPHFEFKDDGTPAEKRATGPARGAPHHGEGLGLYANHVYDDGTNASKPEERRELGRAKHASQNSTGIGLYENHLYDDGTEFGHHEETRGIGPAKHAFRNSTSIGLYENHFYENSTRSSDGDKEPLKTITNNAGRKDAFGSHWDNTDASPANGTMDNENKTTGGNRKNASKRMDSHWDTYDESPEQQRNPTNKTVRKGLESHWEFGDEADTRKMTKANSRPPHQGLWDF